MRSASVDDAPVRTFNGIRYVGEPARGGWLWRGGTIGGEIWTRPGAPAKSFTKAAFQAQVWARRDYRVSCEFMQAFEADLATVGKEYALAFREELGAGNGETRQLDE